MKILGDSWNYMPPILVLSSAKRIATQILVITKINEREDFIWEVFLVISSVPARNYLSKVSNWSTRKKCENCSRLRVKTLERCHWRRSSIYIVNCKHFSNFLLSIEFEQANVFWVNIEDKIRCIMRYVVVVYVWPKFINK